MKRHMKSVLGVMACLTAVVTQAALVPPSGLSSFADWNFDNTGVGGVDSATTGTDWATKTPATASPAFTIVTIGSDAASEFDVNEGKSRLQVIGRSDGVTDGTTDGYLSFGSSSKGFVSAQVGVNSGTSFTSGMISLVNVSGTTITPLLQFVLNGKQDNAGNTIVTGDGSTLYAGLWEDVFNTVQFSWEDGVGSVFVDTTGNGANGGETTVSNASFLSALTPNAIYFEAGGGTATNSRRMYLDELAVQMIPEPATLGLVAVFGGAVLFIRRCFMM
ncbi:hypothetical protein [Pontiella sulfatireligans]|uniref:PEP-CTERM protein-sorting domain-containing protein n=1 Tax=Pontiella sulfatireligans TaxID=2750658 RepID=A0A6C2UD76_9BACT|nr:hypothetical protein [Pontiella sulfatireligans]VGO18152.1 hypothetical protein SCARR_00203 [Pontiella sulfatireligans]